MLVDESNNDDVIDEEVGIACTAKTERNKGLFSFFVIQPSTVLLVRFFFLQSVCAQEVHCLYLCFHFLLHKGAIIIETIERNMYF